MASVLQLWKFIKLRTLTMILQLLFIFNSSINLFHHTFISPWKKASQRQWLAEVFIGIVVIHLVRTEAGPDRAIVWPSFTGPYAP